MAEVVPSFDVSMPDIRKVELERPWQWLAAGWRDLVRTPGLSLAFGVVFAAVGYAMTLGALARRSRLSRPSARVRLRDHGTGPRDGLYEISRRQASGEPVSLAAALSYFQRNPRQIAVMSFILLLLLLTWVRLAAMIFMLYWGLKPPSFEDLIVNTFLRPESLPFLVFGTAAGAVFAAIAFAISVVSIPMLLDQPRVDVITAIVTSVRVVRENPKPMLFWAALIAGFAGAGLVTLYLGLIVTLPLIGHATWHACKDLVVMPGDETA